MDKQISIHVCMIRKEQNLSKVIQIKILTEENATLVNKILICIESSSCLDSFALK